MSHAESVYLSARACKTLPLQPLGNGLSGGVGQIQHGVHGNPNRVEDAEQRGLNRRGSDELGFCLPGLFDHDVAA
jgi:hypothetical protein